MSTIVSAASLLDNASGPHFIPASAGCYYPPAVEGPDPLEVDSSVRELVSDGLYLNLGWRHEPPSGGFFAGAGAVSAVESVR